MADGIPASEQKIHMQPPPLQSQPSDGQYPPRAAMVQPGMPQPAMPYQPAGPGTFMSQPQSIPGPQPQVVGDQYRAQLFAQCAQGIHDPHTKYGVCGIITAVVCKFFELCFFIAATFLGQLKLFAQLKRFSDWPYMSIRTTLPSVWNTLGWQMNVITISDFIIIRFMMPAFLRGCLPQRCGIELVDDFP
ncbi:hypothetical protein EV360DRAFT_87815 [Lentinula raphanica]|nr:hypothetical protein EV360DRAFT_87815 [Lentinula raphanica]